MVSTKKQLLWIRKSIYAFVHFQLIYSPHSVSYARIVLKECTVGFLCWYWTWYWTACLARVNLFFRYGPECKGKITDVRDLTLANKRLTWLQSPCLMIFFKWTKIHQSFRSIVCLVLRWLRNTRLSVLFFMRATSRYHRKLRMYVGFSSLY